MKSVVIFVFGRVQGVYYRASTLSKANSLSLTGWVRNRLNGSVEIQASGSEKKIDELINWTKIGSMNARVERIVVEEIQLDSPLTSFTIEETT